MPRMPKGQGLVEYAFLLVFVAILVLVVLFVFGPHLGNIYHNIGNSLPAS